MQKEKPNKTVLAGHKHELLQKIVTANDIRQALKKDEFMLYYQPQINSRSGCLTGMEALLRWKHPARGFISPKQFIAIAEETGQIIEIGDWALRAACRQRKIWNNMGLIQIPLAVNISICQLENHHIIETITEILQETGLDSKWLELEITESSAISNFNYVACILRRLKKLRISVAIDDFGTGNTTFDHLRMFPIDTIKIDKSYINKIGVNATDEAILRSIISLASFLNMRVVAEGVEKKQQIDFLMTEGCDIIQGFYYYKPLPAKIWKNF